MQRIARELLVGLTAASVCVSAHGTTSDAKPEQFREIPNRNVFGLKEAPKAIIDTPPPQLPKLVLTGITTIFGMKQALLKLLPAGVPPGKPGDPASEQFLTLAEGQREGGVEVMQIDEKNGSVKVKISGSVMMLTFERDGLKLPPTHPTTNAATPPPPFTADAVPPSPAALPIPYAPSARWQHNLPHKIAPDENSSPH